MKIKLWWSTWSHCNKEPKNTKKVIPTWKTSRQSNARFCRITCHILQLGHRATWHVLSCKKKIGKNMCRKRHNFIVTLRSILVVVCNNVLNFWPFNATVRKQKCDMCCKERKLGEKNSVCKNRKNRHHRFWSSSSLSFKRRATTRLCHKLLKKMARITAEYPQHFVKKG